MFACSLMNQHHSAGVGDEHRHTRANTSPSRRSGGIQPGCAMLYFQATLIDNSITFQSHLKKEGSGHKKLLCSPQLNDHGHHQVLRQRHITLTVVITSHHRHHAQLTRLSWAAIVVRAPARVCLCVCVCVSTHSQRPLPLRRPRQQQAADTPTGRQTTELRKL